MIKKKYSYIDYCQTFEILLQDSGISPKPKEDWNTFTPKKGDIAHVEKDNLDYEFDGHDWILKVE